MTQKEMLKTIISTLDKKKAESIQAIKISDLTILADYFIIASGNSSTQTRTLTEEEWNILQVIPFDVVSWFHNVLFAFFFPYFPLFTEHLLKYFT